MFWKYTLKGVFSNVTKSEPQQIYFEKYFVQSQKLFLRFFLKPDSSSSL